MTPASEHTDIPPHTEAKLIEMSHAQLEEIVHKFATGDISHEHHIRDHGAFDAKRKNSELALANDFVMLARNLLKYLPDEKTYVETLAVEAAGLNDTEHHTPHYFKELNASAVSGKPSDNNYPINALAAKSARLLQSFSDEGYEFTDPIIKIWIEQKKNKLEQ